MEARATQFNLNKRKKKNLLKFGNNIFVSEKKINICIYI